MLALRWPEAHPERVRVGPGRHEPGTFDGGIIERQIFMLHPGSDVPFDMRTVKLRKIASSTRRSPVHHRHGGLATCHQRGEIVLARSWSSMGTWLDPSADAAALDAAGSGTKEAEEALPPLAERHLRPGLVCFFGRGRGLFLWDNEGVVGWNEVPMTVNDHASQSATWRCTPGCAGRCSPRTPHAVDLCAGQGVPL